MGGLTSCFPVGSYDCALPEISVNNNDKWIGSSFTVTIRWKNSTVDECSTVSYKWDQIELGLGNDGCL